MNHTPIPKTFTTNLLMCYCINVTFLLVNVIICAVVYNLYYSPTIYQPAAGNGEYINDGRYVREFVTDNAHKKLPENYNSQMLETDGNGITNDFSSNEINHYEGAMATESHGYVLPYQLYEQQTAAARNLWGLQYWANTVDMKVVEPFFMNYGMSFKPMVVGQSNPPRFSDLYDREFWNKQSSKRNCSELVTWEDFIAHAPKKAILVVVTAPKSNRRNSVNDTVINIISDPKSISSSQECVGIDFTSEAMSYFSKEGFEYVRKVCIVFAKSSPMDVTTFTQHILGPYHPKTVTVMFSHWKGIQSGRVNLKDVKLTNDNTVVLGMLPSEKTVKESELYLEKLKLNDRVKYNGEKYFGVMVRFEKAYTHFVDYQNHSSEIFWTYLMKCASTMTSLKQFRIHKNWGRVLAIDVGKLGSLLIQRMSTGPQGKNIAKAYKTFFTSVFGKDSWTIDEFENSFNKYLNITDPVHIAQLQRTIAAKSDCLVLVGGGSTFQQAAISFYKNFHPNTKEHCIIQHCYYGENFNLLD